MVVFTSSNGRRSAGSRIYECGSLVSGEDQKFPSLKTIESDFKEEVELIVNLKEERYLIWRVKGVEEEMKITLNEKQFPLNSELYLFVSMPEECRVRVRKIYRSSITF